MARKSSVRYYPSRSAFFTVYRGERHKLAEGPDDQPDGPTFLAALTAFRGLTPRRPPRSPSAAARTWPPVTDSA